LVAITRTRDYRHHWHDVCIGSILGALCAYFAYRQYYPDLANPRCQHPFALRFQHQHHHQQESLLPFVSPEGLVPVSDGARVSLDQPNGHGTYNHRASATLGGTGDDTLKKDDRPELVYEMHRS
jgi:diacylglycerol diphosphate phosphatase/phosphatidate phosphatase